MRICVIGLRGIPDVGGGIEASDSDHEAVRQGEFRRPVACCPNGVGIAAIVNRMGESGRNPEGADKILGDPCRDADDGVGAGIGQPRRNPRGSEAGAPVSAGMMGGKVHSLAYGDFRPREPRRRHGTDVCMGPETHHQRRADPSEAAGEPGDAAEHSALPAEGVADHTGRHRHGVRAVVENDEMNLVQFRARADMGEHRLQGPFRPAEADRVDHERQSGLHALGVSS
jgi:hypothetical protein